MEEQEIYQVGEALEPAEQQTIMFYGKPLVVVRLPSGAPGVVLSSFCTNLKLDVTGQVNRIRRKKALEAGLCYARIDTPGGQQVMAVLELRVVPGWLFGIDANRAREEMRSEIERYQAECVDVLYQWASTPRLEAPAGLIPAEQIIKPEAPGEGAGPQEWRAYHQSMIEFLDWQASVETWRNSVDTRLGNIEAVIPDILQRLPPPTITPAHQNQVKYYVSQLVQHTGKSYATVYSALDTAFHVPRYQELLEADWSTIERWFKRQLPGQGDRPEQDKLF